MEWKGNIDDKGGDIKRIWRPANGVRLKVVGNLREISRFTICLFGRFCLFFSKQPNNEWNIYIIRTLVPHFTLTHSLRQGKAIPEVLERFKLTIASITFPSFILDSLVWLSRANIACLLPFLLPFSFYLFSLSLFALTQTFYFSTLFECYTKLIFFAYTQGFLL